MPKKAKSVSNQQCGDCVHHWACATWNVGSIASMDGTNCANFERFVERLVNDKLLSRFCVLGKGDDFIKICICVLVGIFAFEVLDNVARL